MGRADVALERATQATERFPLVPRLWVDLAHVHQLRGDGPGERAALEQAVRINPGWGTAARELAAAHERAGDFALASVCVGAACDEAGTCTWIRVGLGAVASTPVRSPAAEAAYLGSRLDPAASDAACAALAGEIRPRGGLHAPAEFRAELAAVLLRRAIARIYAQSASAVSA